jgi:glutamine synthetase
MAKTSRESTLAQLEQQQVRFLRLQLTDILGNLKNVEVPESQFSKALDGQITFDGFSVQGFTRMEEADMLLQPDLSTFRVFPDFSAEEARHGRVARLICDVILPGGASFAGDPREVLRRQVARAAELGLTCYCGLEPEFFLFERTASGDPSTAIHDAAGYFDLAPLDRGERLRREMTTALTAMGFEIEASHHEVAPGQHEIDFRYTEVLAAADQMATFKFMVKRIALEYGLHASFMPKPVAGVNGNGLHIHLSLFREGKNLFYGAGAENQLSQTALLFIAGLLAHARALTALTNPLVNSYKRLVPGFEAPTTVAWSASSRNAMVRVPARRGQGTRVELRIPDPACNLYLALAALLAAGLDGLERGELPPPAIGRDIPEMTVRERRKHRIRELPSNLSEAIDEFEADPLIQEVIPEVIREHYVLAKRLEWRLYSEAVHLWELERYLATV